MEFSIKEHSKAVVLVLRNRAESEMYDEVVSFGDYFVAYRKNEAFVLDKDLKMVFQTSTKTQTLSYCNAENGRISIINHWYTPASDWNEYVLSFILIPTYCRSYSPLPPIGMSMNDNTLVHKKHTNNLMK